MSTNLYIYYKVAASRAQEFDHAAAAMQAELSLQHQINTALKRSAEIKDEHHTWMEVYSSVPPDFAQVIAQAVAKHGLADFIDGPRHTEFFVNISSCA
jgi:thiaminase